MKAKINHVAILLPELDQGTAFWVDALGLSLEKKEKVPEQEVEIAFLPVGDSHIELVAPTSESSGVARYLQKKGPGLHHICLEVDDIRAALARLKQAGVQLIDDEPKPGSAGKLLAFIHPKSTGGVLVELYELPQKNK